MAKKKANANGMVKKKLLAILAALGRGNPGAQNTAKQASPAFGFQHMLAAIVAISLCESALAGSGIIPPILSYSPANLLFAFLRLAIVVYAGAEYASSGMARAALRGGALFLASSMALCISVAAAPYFATHPILGLFVLDGQMPPLFATIILENTVVGAVIAAVVAWLSGQQFFRKLLPSKKS